MEVKLTSQWRKTCRNSVQQKLQGFLALWKTLRHKIRTGSFASLAQTRIPTFTESARNGKGSDPIQSPKASLKTTRFYPLGE